jgi:putative transcriptional regulator
MPIYSKPCRILFARRNSLSTQINIPRFVRELRKRTGLTQEKFAAKLGVTFPTINRWENGRAKPSPLAMQKIEELLRKMGDSGNDLLKRLFEK